MATPHRYTCTVRHEAILSRDYEVIAPNPAEAAAFARLLADKTIDFDDITITGDPECDPDDCKEQDNE
jgi:hypothetical protein